MSESVAKTANSSKKINQLKNAKTLNDITDPQILLNIMDKIYSYKQLGANQYNDETKEFHLKKLKFATDLSCQLPQIFLRLHELKYKFTRKNFTAFMKYIGERQKCSPYSSYGSIRYRNRTPFLFTNIPDNKKERKTLIEYIFQFTFGKTYLKYLIENLSKNSPLDWFQYCIRNKKFSKTVNMTDSLQDIKLHIGGGRLINFVIGEKLSVNNELLKSCMYDLIKSKHKIKQFIDLMDEKIDYKSISIFLSQKYLTKVSYAIEDVMDLMCKDIDKVNSTIICDIMDSGSTNAIFDKIINYFLNKNMIDVNSLAKITFSNLHKFEHENIPILVNNIIKRDFIVDSVHLSMLITRNIWIDNEYEFFYHGNIKITIKDAIFNFKKLKIVPDELIAMSLIHSKVNINKLDEYIKEFDLEISEKYLTMAVLTNNIDLIKYFIGYKLQIDDYTFNLYCKKCRKPKNEIIELLLASSDIKLDYEKVEIIIRKGIYFQEYDLFQIDMGEELYYLMYKYENFAHMKACTVDDNKIILRNMFKKKDLPTIKKFMKENNIGFDTYCVENAFKRTYWSNWKILEFLENNNCKYSLKCMLFAGGMKDKNIQNSRINNFYNIVGVESYFSNIIKEDYKFMSEEFPITNWD